MNGKTSLYLSLAAVGIFVAVMLAIAEEIDGARHTEPAWAAIAPAMLQFLYPAVR